MGFDFAECKGCRRQICLNNGYGQCHCGKVFCKSCEDSLIQYAYEGDDEYFCEQCAPYSVPDPTDEELLLFLLNGRPRRDVEEEYKKTRPPPKELVCGDCNNAGCDNMKTHSKEELHGYCCICMDEDRCDKCEKRKKIKTQRIGLVICSTGALHTIHTLSIFDSVHIILTHSSQAT